MVRYATRILSLNFSPTLCELTNYCTYINKFDTVAHHISRLDNMSHGKDEVEHRWC